MKHEKKELREVVTEEEVVCDKCGKPIGDSLANFENFSISARLFYVPGDRPFDSIRKEYNLDLCRDHAEEAIALLIDNGFAVQIKEWEV